MEVRPADLPSPDLIGSSSAHKRRASLPRKDTLESAQSSFASKLGWGICQWGFSLLKGSLTVSYQLLVLIFRGREDQAREVIEEDVSFARMSDSEVSSDELSSDEEISDDPEFEKPWKDLHAEWKKDPHAVVDFYLNWLNKDMEGATQDLLEIAKDWKANPEKYLAHKDGKENQRKFIGAVDDKILSIILSEEDRKAHERAVSLPEIKDSVIDNEGRDFLNNADHIGPHISMFFGLIQKVLSPHVQKNPSFEDLKLGTTFTVFGDSSLSFGVFLERLWIKRSSDLESILSEDVLDKNGRLLRTKIIPYFFQVSEFEAINGKTWEECSKYEKKILRKKYGRKKIKMMRKDKVIDSFPIFKALLPKIKSLLLNPKFKGIKELILGIVKS